jgi:hypothetical protein
MASRTGIPRESQRSRAAVLLVVKVLEMVQEPEGVKAAYPGVWSLLPVNPPEAANNLFQLAVQNLQNTYI